VDTKALLFQSQIDNFITVSPERVKRSDKKQSFYKVKTALAAKSRVIFISVQPFVALQAKTSRKDCFVRKKIN
jgi:hypothetical protein